MEINMKKELLLVLAATAVIGLSVPAAADPYTYTTPEGILSLELPNESWKEITDLTKWVALSDGANLITIEHYSNGEKLPDITVADAHYCNVFQGVFSTQNEVFILTGSVVDADVIQDIANTIASTKVLQFDTKTAVKKDADASPNISEFSLAPLDKTMYVTSDGLNVRSGCSTSDPIIGAYAYGASVHVTGSVQRNGADIGWYQVSYDSGSGYVSSQFLSDSEPADKKSNNSSGYTGDVKTIYEIDGHAVTVYKSTDGYWYDKAGTQYNQISDYEFIASNGAPLSLYKPQVQNNNVPDGDPFTVYWANGNTTTLTHYTDGYFYSSDWVRYTLSGAGTYSGADGTVLYANDPWTQQPSGSYYGENEEGGEDNKSVKAAEAGYVTIYDSAGNSVTVYLAEDAYWYDKAGNQYIQMGNGTFETPGGTVYYY